MEKTHWLICPWINRGCTVAPSRIVVYGMKDFIIACRSSDSKYLWVQQILNPDDAHLQKMNCHYCSIECQPAPVTPVAVGNTSTSFFHSYVWGMSLMTTTEETPRGICSLRLRIEWRAGHECKEPNNHTFQDVLHFGSELWFSLLINVRKPYQGKLLFGNYTTLVPRNIDT